MAYNLFILTILISALVSAGLFIVFWNRRPAPGAGAVAVMMLVASLWAIFYVLETQSYSLSQKILFVNFQYIAYTLAPVTWFIFTLRYTGHDKWLNRFGYLLLIVPFITLEYIWTNQYHQLMWTSVRLETLDSHLILVKTYGVWFWVHAGYSYLVAISGLIVLISNLYNQSKLYRGQMLFLSTAFLPGFTSLVYILSPGLFHYLDLTPVAVSLSGFALLLGVFRYRILDIVPILKESIIETMNQGYLILDAQGRVLDLNPVAEEVLDRRSQRILGRKLDGIPGIDSEVIAAISQSRHDPEVSWFKAESSKYFKITSRAYLRNGVDSGRLVLIQDVTGEKLDELEKAELERKAQLNSRLASVGELAAGIAHEVNNPLTTVIGYADLLLKDTSLGEEQQQSIKVIGEEAWRAATILRRLLSYAGSYGEKPEAVSVNQIIDICLELKKAPLNGANIEVIKELTENLPAIGIPGNLLQEVLLNLISNAQESIKESGRRGRLVIKTHREADMIVITVQDNGTGIKKEHMPRLFEPFFSTKCNGHGLGLSVSHGIVVSHGGEIHAESHSAGGATFIVALPISSTADGTGTQYIPPHGLPNTQPPPVNDATSP